MLFSHTHAWRSDWACIEQSSPSGFLCKVFRFAHVVLSDALLFFAVLGDSDELSDNELADLAKKDEQRFTELYDRYLPRVYQFFYCRLRQKQDAEDLTSEAFLKIYAKLDTFHEQGVPFGAWVFKIARNSLVDHLRKKKKYEAESIDEVPSSLHPLEEFDLGKIDQRICRKQLWKAISTLPERQQQLWALKLASGLPHREIAGILKTSEDNVNVMVHRSMKTLKRRLAPLHVPAKKNGKTKVGKLSFFKTAKHAT